MLGTGGGPPRAPPSPAKAAVIEMFGESHAFNGVAGGVESGLFAPSNSTSALQKSWAEDAAAGALLCLQGAGDKEESSRAQQGEQGPPKKNKERRTAAPKRPSCSCSSGSWRRSWRRCRSWTLSWIKLLSFQRGHSPRGLGSDWSRRRLKYGLHVCRAVWINDRIFLE